MGKPATRAKNKYNARNYDRLNINVPQGDRELIRMVAERKRYVNQHIRNPIDLP